MQLYQLCNKRKVDDKSKYFLKAVYKITAATVFAK